MSLAAKRKFAVLWRKRRKSFDGTAPRFQLMAEIRTVTTLTNKRDEIARAIVNYENKITQAKVDLAHINAAIRIFEIGDEGIRQPKNVAPYLDIARMFKRGEMVAISKAALAKGRLNTRQLSAFLLNAKV